MFKRPFERLFTVFVMSGMLFVSCGKTEEPQLNIELPATSILADRSRFALIVSSHLRLRESPGLDGKVKETLWKGAVMEIQSKASARELVENQEGYWYQVSYDGLQGYVFGGYLRFFNSREAAEEAARNPE